METVYDPLLGKLRTMDSPSDKDVEITDASKGVIMKDANGVRWRVTTETDGTLKRTPLP